MPCRYHTSFFFFGISFLYSLYSCIGKSHVLSFLKKLVLLCLSYYDFCTVGKKNLQFTLRCCSCLFQRWRYTSIGCFKGGDTQAFFSNIFLSENLCLKCISHWRKFLVHGVLVNIKSFEDHRWILLYLKCFYQFKLFIAVAFMVRSPVVSVTLTWRPTV